jgi:hypothetical protein
MDLPETVFVSRKDVCRYFGITKYDLLKAVKARLIHQVKLPRRKYGKYLRAEVIRIFQISGFEISKQNKIALRRGAGAPCSGQSRKRDWR